MGPTQPNDEENGQENKTTEWRLKATVDNVLSMDMLVR
jgi:hypothetical protein